MATPLSQQWDNSKEYSGLNSPEIERDLQESRKLIAQLHQDTEQYLKQVLDQAPPDWACLDMKRLQNMALVTREADLYLNDLGVLCSCTLSVQSNHKEAQKLQEVVLQLRGDLNAASAYLSNFYLLAPDTLIAKFLDHPVLNALEPLIRFSRTLAPFRLSANGEEILSKMRLNGFEGWGRMYTQLSSYITCQVETKDGPQRMGIARATALVQHPDRRQRQQAYEAMDKAWSSIQEPCCHSLNRIAGWRLDEYRTRMKTERPDFLLYPRHAGRVSQQTLDAMVGAVRHKKDVAQKMLQKKFSILGIDTPQRWDLAAPAPTKDKGDFAYEEAIALIRSSFGDVAPEMADFVDIMVNNRWIEALPSDMKRPGAYCTKFLKSRTPRVFMTFNGTIGDVITLAHELGHAYHNWVMRDQPLEHIRYPMTLAETASVFAQQTVNERLASEAKTEDQRLVVAWLQWRDTITFFLDIMSRFTFEKRFYEERLDGYVTADQLCKMMKDEQANWLGDKALADENFWVKKLHYYVTGISFYNFPYTFGYLFSLGVFHRRHEANFHDQYVALLRDTGIMSAEEVGQKHLQADLTNKDFWLGIIERIETDFQAFA